ncbi:2,5-diamino-6-hydroxy-4-(5-phosphoribosylamino)pyrimidine 1'-reductase [Methanomethylovorans hollandica DSM 15978]|jgi:2,5-diamino-6-(ribosylamino)-4(3H)-pyrimidinone 5'-phosphate reductase|uniref:2,5-diamino-6-(ribosylamino)-4(3H)-pyrimidinone 5'-phosphate reductase n=1 Tax=Methanomethylovorans hollandica (strain DSM 15978 / NBRC 107637 / DMS1) TaxID=867904 RepID=L0L0A6_METHD|nr:2,5-diamino-6-(ribosylamino)-4(3H)-pyrimidinone 5'-phosphate reductase [Methanomethylovorans hollandica]AGB50360.1 2,5-diamino-6-hydroxy-4-(5-phosphoribosylamino)pyrimidine 1'-reductase [Methanomethylovorans hollandica DSM 15978]
MDRPFIFINSAMSADGKISTWQRKQVRISGAIDFDRVDRLRCGSDAIMVGIGTVLADDPSLTVKSVQRKIERKEKGFDENPVRVIIDSQARTPIDADIFKKGEGRRIVVVSSSAPSENVKALRRKAMVIIAGESRVDLPDAMEQLYLLGINRLMVEGGATLNWAMLSSGLVDEIYTFVGNVIIGGQVAPTLVDGEGFKDTSTLPLELISAEKIEQGILLKWKVLNFQ